VPKKKWREEEEEEGDDDVKLPTGGKERAAASAPLAVSALARRWLWWTRRGRETYPLRQQLSPFLANRERGGVVVPSPLSAVRPGVDGDRP